MVSQVSKIPHDPGVYLMKDKEGKIIYIGKAKDLKKRVTSYFTKKAGGDVSVGWKTAKLVSKISDIEYMITDSEIEAFLLESNLIKRYRPVFNIELKDQQRYTYLKITDEDFPRLVVARRNRNGQFHGPPGKVYGPFVKGSSKFLTAGLLRKLFKIRVCNTLPKRPCLQYFIKNCDAPCIDREVLREYSRNVEALRAILEGKSTIEKFASELEGEMEKASQFLQYEKAKAIRDTLYRLNNLRTRQKMEKAISKSPNEEYIGIIRDEANGIAHVMALRRTHGVISDRRKFEFELVADNSIGTFLSQYYSATGRGAIPSIIYVNEEPESTGALEESLRKISGHGVRILAVDKSKKTSQGEKGQLMSLIVRNLEQYIQGGYNPAVIELKNILGLERVPAVIDCFDVSNLGTAIAVGACSRFVNGKPYKAGYRKFKIKTIFGQNDFAMIKEIVGRRYDSEVSVDNAASNNNNSSGLPDLIVIDGGPGQMRSAVSALEELELYDIPCISLAKENEEIYTPNSSQPISIAKSNAGLKLLQHARDEVHRFGLAYNVALRKLKTKGVGMQN